MMKMPCMACALCFLVFTAPWAFARDTSEKPDEQIFQRLIYSQLIPFAQPGRAIIWNTNAPYESERVLYVASTDLRLSLIILEADLAAFQGRRETIDEIAARLAKHPLLTKLRRDLILDVETSVKAAGKRVHL